MNLYDRVIDQLQRRKGQWGRICEDTGLDYSWLSKMAQGRIADPGVHKLQKLADYFDAKEAA